MDHDFWHSKWAKQEIGFDQFEENPHLASHGAVLGRGKRVLVPLCGKSIDMTFLAAAGHVVVGVELVERAVKDFFTTLGGKPKVTQEGAFTRYDAGSVVIFVGDFFKTTRELLGPVDALYDRASLIALPEPMRRDYARHLRTLMPAHAPGLLVTVEYDEAKAKGPPFSVRPPELEALYGAPHVEALGELLVTDNPRLKEAGAREKAWRLTF